MQNNMESGSVTRSRSFNSILFTRRKYGSHSSRSFSRSSKYAYLGQNFMTPSQTSSKVNPNKTSHAIEGLQSGLKNCIRALRNEIDACSGEIQTQQHSKSLHLQLKTLEYQQSRLENLYEQYVLQQKLREGVRTMAYAYTLSTGKDRELALSNVKAGFRECTQVLGSLESQLQEFLGGFHLTMKGIQGFARLCPGDVYEITVKHGNQKWKTRAKVTKDGGQNWDFPEAKVTAILGEDLYIKAAEIKTLGKQILLGNKFCEICELFSSHPQLMTVNLNPSGSLKLNIVVQWDPLAQFYEEPNSPLRKRRMMISPTLLKHSRSQKWPKLKEIIEPGEEELKESLNKLAGIVNDEIQGQFSELEALEFNVAALKRIANQEYINHKTERSRSTTSLNIESALECFDFLDSCDVMYSPQPSHRHTHHSSIGLFPLEEDSKTTTDSGISSLNSRSPSPEVSFVTGSEQLDLALATHVQICLSLVNKLGSFGPLKWKEKNAINKLQQQGTILGSILNRMNEKDDYVFELDGMPFIQKLWMDITQSTTTLVTTVDQVVYGLEREVRKHTENSHGLSRALVLQILDETIFKRHALLTLFQFIVFLKPYETSFQRLVADVAEEEMVLQKLSNPNGLEDTLSELRKGGTSVVVPSKSVFVTLARFLTHEDMHFQEVVTHYFMHLAEHRRRHIVENCLEMLESESPSDRHSGIVLLTLINAEETVGEVAYLAQTDGDTKVREAAKQMLMSQKEGDRMHTQLTLNSHGFQGLLA